MIVWALMYELFIYLETRIVLFYMCRVRSRFPSTGTPSATWYKLSNTERVTDKFPEFAKMQNTDLNILSLTW